MADLRGILHPKNPRNNIISLISHFSIFTIESGIEIESNKEKTIYTAREVRQIWKRSEGFKWESINRDIYQRLTYPFIARFIPTWEKRYLGREELENLQIYVRTFTDKGRVEATAKIFKHLGLVRAGEIVKNFEKIRGLGDEDINRWLAGLTDEMSQSILDGTIPPIMVIKPEGVDFGNLPDGNHRVLTALLLSEDYPDIKLPAFVGTLDKSVLAIHNGIFSTLGSNAMKKEELGELLEKRGITSKA